jgi:nucleoid DNA-binding protein
MTLTKREIARAIHAAEPGISLTDAVRQVDRLFAILKRRLERGERVMITNFGAFEVAERAPRRGVNPATGESMVIPAHRAVSFHPAPALLEAMNG